MPPDEASSCGVHSQLQDCEGLHAHTSARTAAPAHTPAWKATASLPFLCNSCCSWRSEAPVAAQFHRARLLDRPTTAEPYKLVQAGYEMSRADATACWLQESHMMHVVTNKGPPDARQPFMAAALHPVEVRARMTCLL